MLEEHSNIEFVKPADDAIDNTAKTLGVHKNFAFWVSLILVFLLIPLAFFSYTSDKDDIKRFGIRGNPYLKKYTLYCFLRMSMKQGKKDMEMDEVARNDSNFQELGQTSNPTHFDNDTRSLADLARINTPGPQITRLESEEKDDEFDKEEDKEHPDNTLDMQNSNILEESKDNLKYMRNEFDQELDTRVKLHLSRVPIGEKIEKEEKKDSPKSSVSKTEVDSPKSVISRKEKNKIESALQKKSRNKVEKSEFASIADVEDIQSVSSDEDPVPSEANNDNESKIQSMLTVTSSASKKRSRSRKRSRKRKRRTKQEIVLSDDEELKEDPDMMEGGEDDDIETGGTMMKDIDFPLPKKKKKKWIKRKKKPKQADFSDISSVGYEDDSTVKSIQLNRENSDKFRKNSQFDSTSLRKQNKFQRLGTFNEQSEAGSNAFTRQGTAAMKVVNNKAHERHYDGKILCRTLFYSHRIIGLFTYYNERLPRIHRLLILYVSVFLMLFLSGIFFYQHSEKKNVAGWSYGH